MNLDVIRKEENERETRIHERLADSIKRRAFNVVLAESKGKKVADKMYEKFMMTPSDFVERCFVKVSLACIYRRYRQVEMKTLVDALGIVGRADTLKDAQIAISERLRIVGKAHVDSQKRMKK